MDHDSAMNRAEPRDLLDAPRTPAKRVVSICSGLGEDGRVRRARRYFSL